MHTNTQTAGTPPPDLILHGLIDSHGPWRILASLARVLVRRKRSAALPGDLTDHLRRDMGLPEHDAQPPRIERPWF